MKAFVFILPLLSAIPSTASAQQIPRKSIQDSVIGWMKVYKFTGVRAPVTVDAKHYSAAQMSIRHPAAVGRALRVADGAEPVEVAGLERAPGRGLGGECGRCAEHGEQDRQVGAMKHGASGNSRS